MENTTYQYDESAYKPDTYERFRELYLNYCATWKILESLWRPQTELEWASQKLALEEDKKAAEAWSDIWKRIGHDLASEWANRVRDELYG